MNRFKAIAFGLLIGATAHLSAAPAVPSCEVAYIKNAAHRSQQAMALRDGLLFAFEHGGKCVVYDRTGAQLREVGSFSVESASDANHCNQANWGVESVNGSEFPVVYLSVAQPKSPLDLRCHVESISRRKGKWRSELVQTIELDTTGWNAQGVNTIFGAPSWLVDRQRRALWVFSGRRRTVPAATPDFADNKLVALRFRLPALSEGSAITLGADDVLEQVVFDMDAYATQSGMIHDGKIFYCFGFGDKYPQTTSKLRVYDLDRRCIAARVELDSLIPEECEAVAIDGDRMLINTNSPKIYSVPMPEMSADNRWYGTYRVSTFGNAEQRNAPEGYTPFMISTYCRHGIRHIDSSSVLPLIRKALEWGDSAGALTHTGASALERLRMLWPTVNLRTGDLTAGGSRQWQTYAAKITAEYPEVMAPGAKVRAQSTNVMRTARSMEAFNCAIASLTGIADVRGDVSSSFHTFLNPYANDCPTKLPIDESLRSHDGKWYALWRGFVERNIDLEEWLARIFTTPEAASPFDAVELCAAMFTLRCAAPWLDRPESFTELFTPEQADAMWEAENVRQYMQKGRHPVNMGRGWQQAGRILENIIDVADSDIESGYRGLRMRFGHDGCMMALLALLDAGSWGESTSDLNRVKDIWQTWRIPMASRLNFVFFRNDAGHVLVKVLLNGEEQHLPMPQHGRSGCYAWSDFRPYALRRVAASLSALEVPPPLKPSHE